MNIARIVRIEPDGKPFTTQNGTFYPYVVGFDDHRSGQANSKSNPPPWKVGEVVGYDVTGQTPRGADKFKITRNPDPKMGTFTGQPEADRSNPDLEAASVPAPQKDTRSHAQPSNPPKSSQNAGNSLPVNLPHGATVGMAVKLAGDMLLAENPKLINDENWDVRVRATAYRLIEICRSLETDTPLEAAPF